MTEHLPTPPLPDAISSGRVFEPGSANGMARPSACPWAWACVPGGGRRVAVEALAQLLALVVGHHREVEADGVHPVEGGDGGGDAVGDLVAQRAAGHGEGDQDADPAAVDADVADHAEVDDRAVQLRVLDGPQGLDAPARW